MVIQSSIKRRLLEPMSKEKEIKSYSPRPEMVTDEKLISNLERIIHHLKDGNTYSPEDRELLWYRTEEFVTGTRKKMDPELMKYLFTGWFIHNNLDESKLR